MEYICAMLRNILTYHDTCVLVLHDSVIGGGGVGSDYGLQFVRACN